MEDQPCGAVDPVSGAICTDVITSSPHTVHADRSDELVITWADTAVLIVP